MSHGLAQARADRINIQIISTLAARRALVGVGQGERAHPGPARAAFELVQLSERRASGEVVEITRPGFRTARRKVPQVLARMDETDPRRRACDLYAQAVEKIGSIAGVSAEGARADGGPATNDGGVTTRIKHAATIRAVECALDGTAPAITPSARGGGDRKPISRRTLIDAICLRGSDLKSVLTGAGWSGHRRDVATLTLAAEDALEVMARALGLIDPAARAAGDEATPLGVCNVQNKNRLG